jgi:hypothetical protein
MEPFDMAFEALDGCECSLTLEGRAVSRGALSERMDSISWDGVLHHDVWSRMGQDRRLALQDVRADFVITTISPDDALEVSGLLRDTTADEFGTIISEHLTGTGFAIGQVYLMGEPRTEQVVVPGNGTRTTSKGSMSKVPLPLGFLAILSAAVALL